MILATADLVQASDTTPYIAALDEEAYVQGILPFLDNTHEVSAYPQEDEHEGTPPIPGHFHEFDRGYWG